MSMSALINSADCGPINPLQGLSKQLDRDRGLQQDHFGSSSQAGPSRLGGFRSAPSSTPQSAQFAREANQFFSNVQSTPEVSQTRPFSPSMIAGPSRPLHTLDPSARAMTPTEAWKMDGPIASGSRVMQNPAVSRAASDWALDFNVIGQREQNSAPMLQSSQPSLGYQPYSPMNMGASQYSSPIQWNEVAKASINSQPNQINAAPDWAAQFANIEEQTQEPAATTSEPTSSAVVVDDLAAAAGLLVSSMSHEKSDKFKNSEFMGLMRRLRDREAIVDGQTIIETSQSGATASPLDLGKSWTDEFTSTTSLDKGKGRAVDPIPTTTANAFTPTAGYGFTQGRPSYIPLSPRNFCKRPSPTSCRRRTLSLYE
ncbi:hypothetical protein DL93DRAFT_2131326 [Clavulina sp. PMI_390]|nr:hypothetical protein DL93DRAFT_2131326 [Clavulina sp. PMI_390]